MTFRQNVRHKRDHHKRRYNRSPKMDGCPMKLGVCIKVGTTKPKKPNSAIRKIAKVKLLSTMLNVRAVIPGTGYELAEHNTVALRAGRSRDIPGIHYKLIRGVADLGQPLRERRQRRSKFGQQQFVYVFKDEETDRVHAVAGLRSTRNRFEREHGLPLTFNRRVVIMLPVGTDVVFPDEQDMTREQRIAKREKEQFERDEAKKIPRKFDPNIYPWDFWAQNAARQAV